VIPGFKPKTGDLLATQCNSATEELLIGVLVQIKLSICGWGCPDYLAAIYLIEREEFKAIKQLLSRKKGGDFVGDTDEEVFIDGLHVL